MLGPTYNCTQSGVGVFSENTSSYDVADKADYEKILEDDNINIIGLQSFEPGKQLTVQLNHKDGTTDEFKVNHSYNSAQIDWFRAGSALNIIKKQFS